jgi:plastocyanin
MNNILGANGTAALITASLIFVGVALVLAPTPAMAQSTVNVGINNFSFSPSSIVVVIGVNNTVTWTNQQTGTNHTVTANDNSWGSGGPILTGHTYTHTFTAAGTFDYHCSIHPTMTGKVIVESPSTTATASSTNGGGIPEFPLAPVGLAVITALVLVSYLITRRGQAHPGSFRQI